MFECESNLLPSAHSWATWSWPTGCCWAERATHWTLKYDTVHLYPKAQWRLFTLDQIDVAAPGESKDMYCGICREYFGLILTNLQYANEYLFCSTMRNAPLNAELITNQVGYRTWCDRSSWFKVSSSISYESVIFISAITVTQQPNWEVCSQIQASFVLLILIIKISAL